MIIVGELINASRKAIRAAIEAGDAEAIRAVAVDQAAAGAHYIDVNAGVFGDGEENYLKWLVEIVQEATGGRPCCIDSPNPKAIEKALDAHKGDALINSISLENDRYEALLSLVSGTNHGIVALCMSDEGMPRTTDDRVAIGSRLIKGLTNAGVALDHIFVDPLVQPVSAEKGFGMEFLNAVERIMNDFPGVHTMCGLSNVSYGLPDRKLLNRYFMTMAIAKGLDGAIVNPLDQGMMTSIVVAEALAGRDDYCMNYIKAFRAGAIGS